MKTEIYIEFRKKDGTEFMGKHYDYGDRVKPKDIGLSINEAERIAQESDGEIKIIKKRV